MSGVKFPPNGNALTAPFTKAQIKAIGAATRYQLLADVLLALSGIEIFGVAVFSGLSAWAQELQQKAQDAYDSAFNAQGSANYANAQLILLFGDGLASDSGGTAVSALFNGAAATTLSGFTRTGVGPGAGSFGPSGSGAAKWYRSGGNARMLVDRYNTPLTTDYQSVQLILATRPQTPNILGAEAYNWLFARSNSAADTFVYARIGYNKLKVGCYVSGTDTTMPTAGSTPQSISLTANPGDVFQLIVGTDNDDYEIIVKRNDIIVWQDIDNTNVTSMGGSYLYVGLAEACHDRAIFTQTIPGEVTGWSAADRLATSY